MQQPHLTAHLPGAQIDRIGVNGTTIAVETIPSTSGPTVLLLHGFPHTRAVWRSVADRLATEGIGVVAPDLRGLGDSDRTTGEYGAISGARDMTALLDTLGIDQAHVVGFDLGVATAFGLAAWSAERVATLTLIEGMVGSLPGAQDLLAGGGPWWFGFHSAPHHLAEGVVAGSEDLYIRFFLDIGSQTGVPADLAEIFIAAYRGRPSLRAAFDHYRAMPADAEAISAWSRSGRLEMPVHTVGSQPVGDATRRQLEPFADRLTSTLLTDCGHIVPVDKPAELSEALLENLRGQEV